MADVLSRICDEKRALVAERRRQRSMAEVLGAAGNASSPRGFEAALRTAAEDGYGLICEVKKASPSKGLIRADFEPAALAEAYQAGGAACLSVLTDTPNFQGEDAHLAAARGACRLPVLRKDFMLDTYQIAESRALGADAVLLIMAALSDGQAAELEECARELGMDVLIEVHDTDELGRALKLKSPLLGINNRDLKTLEVDLRTAEILAAEAPADRLLVGESGLSARPDLDRLAAAGVRCFLIGESLMRQPDVAAATRAILADPLPRAGVAGTTGAA